MDITLKLDRNTTERILSKREFEVMKLAGDGKNVKEIGAVLHLASQTVSAYLFRIRQKLELSCVAEVRYVAMRWTKDHHQPSELLARYARDADNWRKLVRFVMETEGLVYPPDLREG